MLAQVSPLALVGIKAKDIEIAHHFYARVEYGWDGVGTWVA